MASDSEQLVDSGMIQVALAVAVTGYVIAQFVDLSVTRAMAFIVFVIGSVAAHVLFQFYISFERKRLVRRPNGVVIYLAYVMVDLAFIGVVATAASTLVGLWFLVVVGIDFLLIFIVQART